MKSKESNQQEKIRGVNQKSLKKVRLSEGIFSNKKTSRIMMTWLEDVFVMSSGWRENHPVKIATIRKRKIRRMKTSRVAPRRVKEKRSISSRDKRKSSEETRVFVDAYIMNVLEDVLHSSAKTFYGGVAKRWRNGKE